VIEDFLGFIPLDPLAIGPSSDGFCEEIDWGHPLLGALEGTICLEDNVFIVTVDRYFSREIISFRPPDFDPQRYTILFHLPDIRLCPLMDGSVEGSFEIFVEDCDPPTENYYRGCSFTVSFGGAM